MFDSPVSLKTYRNFKAIEPRDWPRIVRYYERHERAIHDLSPDEFFDCLRTYTEALFHSGQSAKHLVMSDALIREIFSQNIRAWHGDDVFEQVLFQKAASHFNLDEHGRAEHVLRELLKLRPGHQLAKRLLFRVFWAQKPAFLKKTRVAAMFCFLLAVPVIVFQILFERPYWPEAVDALGYFWWACFAAGWLALAAGDGWHWWVSKRKVRHLALAASLKKTRIG